MGGVGGVGAVDRRLVYNDGVMRKYWYVAKTRLLEEAAYPARFLGAVFVSLVSLVLAVFVWKTIFSGKEVVGGFTFTGIITYYSLQFVFSTLNSNWEPANNLSNSIRNGELSMILIKPLSYVKYTFNRIIPKNLLHSALPVIAFLLGILVFPNLIQGTHHPVRFLASSGLAILLSYWIYSTAGLIAFWTIKVWGINNLLRRTFAILSGTLLPLSFFPEGITRFLGYLPFQYTFYTPASIYLGRFTNNTQIDLTIFIQLLWIILFILIYRYIWRWGLTNYESVGN